MVWNASTVADTPYFNVSLGLSTTSMLQLQILKWEGPARWGQTDLFSPQSSLSFSWRSSDEHGQSSSVFHIECNSLNKSLVLCHVGLSHCEVHAAHSTSHWRCLVRGKSRKAWLGSVPQQLQGSRFHYLENPGATLYMEKGTEVISGRSI